MPFESSLRNARKNNGQFSWTKMAPQRHKSQVAARSSLWRPCFFKDEGRELSTAKAGAGPVIEALRK